MSTCPKCKGSGKREIELFFSVVVDKCEECNGSGQVVPPCPKCKKEQATLSGGLFGQIVSPCKKCVDNDNEDLNTYASTLASKWMGDY